MRVLLINPNPVLYDGREEQYREPYVWPPLSLAYIATALRKGGHEVQIHDRNMLLKSFGSKQLDSRLNECLQEFQPEMVGMTATTALMYDCQKISRQVKSFDSNIITIIGGSHPTALPELSLKACPDIDIACRGEAEIITTRLANGEERSSIEGITYRTGEKEPEFHSTKEQTAHIKIDDFAFPARDLIDMEFYTRPGPRVIHGFYVRGTSIHTTRGCPYNCKFCCGNTTNGKKVRYQTPSLVLEEVENLLADYNINALYFTDDMFEAKRSRLVEICEGFIKKGFHKKIKWAAQSRANTIKKDMLELMKEAGCIHLEVGFESGSQRVLDSLEKSNSLQRNLEAAQTIKKAGINLQGNFMVGLPGETYEDALKTYEFIGKVKPDWVAFGQLMPLPGSPYYDEYIEKGFSDLSWTIHTKELPYNFTKMTDEQLKEITRKIRRRYVTPLMITSYMKNSICKTPSSIPYFLKLACGVIS